MGRLSAAARTTPERDRLKAEAIRMHVELDFGINAIEPRIGINKTAIRRWLIAAGCYRAGHRTRQAKNDGAKLIDCRPTDLGRKQIYVHVWQRRAWLNEWKGVAKWDEARHWRRHPAKQLYINAQTYRKAHETELIISRGRATVCHECCDCHKGKARDLKPIGTFRKFSP